MDVDRVVAEARQRGHTWIEGAALAAQLHIEIQSLEAKERLGLFENEAQRLEDAERLRRRHMKRYERAVLAIARLQVLQVFMRHPRVLAICKECADRAAGKAARYTEHGATLH